jgi:uncharacterized membrane protein
VSELINEEWLHGAVSLLVRLVEAAAALVIFTGAAVGFAMFVAAAVRREHTRHFERIRLTMGRFLALGLEFQLGSDLLRTAVAPTWEQIGQLAAVAAIRTALNYFLGREIREEQRMTHEAQTPGRAPAADERHPADLLTGDEATRAERPREAGPPADRAR